MSENRKQDNLLSSVDNTVSDTIPLINVYFPDHAGLESYFRDRFHDMHIKLYPVTQVYLSQIYKLGMLTHHCSLLSRQSGFTEGVTVGLGLTGALQNVVLLHPVVLHLPFYFTDHYSSVVQSVQRPYSGFETHCLLNRHSVGLLFVSSVDRWQ